MLKFSAAIEFPDLRGNGVAEGCSTIQRGLVDDDVAGRKKLSGEKFTKTL